MIQFLGNLLKNLWIKINIFAKPAITKELPKITKAIINGISATKIMAKTIVQNIKLL